MSPVIREQHDEFPMICDVKGRMIVGQFGSVRFQHRSRRSSSSSSR